MPEKDRIPRPAEDAGADQPGRLSRRRMLGAAGAGAAGLAAGALAVGTPALASTSRTDTRAQQPAKDEGVDRVPADEPVVVHVANARTGEVDIYHGTSHTKLHDPALAAKLRRSAK
jgi:hypothetical protein